MEKKLLQRQLIESSIYFADEHKKSRKTEINILLGVLIVCLSFTIRLAERNSLTEVNDIKTEGYFNISPTQVISSYIPSHIA